MDALDLYNFHPKMVEKERYIRGHYTQVSANIEYYLVEIITLLYIDNPELREDFRSTFFCRSTAGKVIPIAENLIKKVCPSYIERFNLDFIGAKKIIEIRNDLAHGRAIFDENAVDTDLMIIRKFNSNGLPITTTYSFYDLELKITLSINIESAIFRVFNELKKEKEKGGT